ALVPIHLPSRRTTTDVTEHDEESAPLTPQEISKEIKRLHHDWHAAVRDLHNEVCDRRSKCFNANQGGVWRSTEDWGPGTVAVTDCDWYDWLPCIWNREGTAA